MLQCEHYAKQGSVRNKQTRMCLTLLCNDSHDLKLYLLRRVHFRGIMCMEFIFPTEEKSVKQHYYFKYLSCKTCFRATK